MVTQPVFHHGQKLQKKMDDFQSVMASVLTGHSYQVTPQFGERDALSQQPIAPLSSCFEKSLQELQTCAKPAEDPYQSDSDGMYKYRIPSHLSASNGQSTSWILCLLGTFQCHLVAHGVPYTHHTM